jgi:uncharacterized protein
MKIALTGATGLVGSALVAALLRHGHEVTVLHRSQAAATEHALVGVTNLAWAWQQPGEAPPDDLNHHDAVIHLAGEPIVGRWTQAKKQRIRNSRVLGTRTLVEGLTRLAFPPKALVSASAIGFYGDRGEAPLTEVSSPGETFLAHVAQGWEDATSLAAHAGIRVCLARIGIILSSQGGALKAMLPVFQLGGGGMVGHGQQRWSWIALPDVVEALLFLATTSRCQGAYNLTAPYPVSNATFTKALGQVLFRPTVVPLPAFAAKLVLGEMADALLLTSAHVLPQRLEQDGFQFQHTALEEALRYLLKAKV